MSSILVEFPKWVYNNWELLSNGLVGALAAKYGIRALRKVGTVDIPPDAIMVTRNVISGELTVSHNRAGAINTGMAFRHPLENRRFIYTGQQSVRLTEVNDQGKPVGITLMHGSYEIPGCIFDTELVYTIVKQNAHLLVEHFGSGPRTSGGTISIAEQLASVLIHHAGTSKGDVLTGIDIREMRKPGQFSRLSKAATKALREQLAEEPWGRAIDAKILVKDFTEPREYREFVERQNQIRIQNEEHAASLHRDVEGVRLLGDRYQQLVGLRNPSARILVMPQNDSFGGGGRRRMSFDGIRADGTKIYRSREIPNSLFPHIVATQALLNDVDDSDVPRDDADNVGWD